MIFTCDDNAIYYIVQDDNTIHGLLPGIIYRFSKLPLQSKINIAACISDVLNLEQHTDRKSYWTSYVRSNGNRPDLTKFFLEWLVYIPAPDSPGRYIERWDWLANTVSGLNLTANDTDFRRWFVDFLNAYGEYIKISVDLLPSTDRDTMKLWYSYNGSKEHPFDINDYIIPIGGFTSFNDFFLRKVKPGLRPVESGDIVSPSDGGIFYLIDPRQHSNQTKHSMLYGKHRDKFTIDNAFPYWERFVGGPVLDTLLWFTDFHHFFAPVAGTVICMADYAGSYNYDFNNFNAKISTSFSLAGESDRVGWYLQFAQHRRFVWIIQTPNIGLVAMSAIGFWNVGSIIIRDSGDGTWMPGARAVMPGDNVQKGDYLGHFGYGGSSIVLAFEKDRNFNFMVGSSPDNPRLVKAGGSIGSYNSR